MSQYDLLAIVEKLVPDAPFLIDLIGDQLWNVKGGESRKRIWSKCVISMCLSLWAH